MILAGGVAAVCTVWMFFVPPKGKTEWRIVAPSDNSFTILMPGVPQETSTLGTSLAYGTVKTTFLMYEKEQWGYSVSWVDYPKGSQKQLDTEMALNQGRDGAVEGVQGKLLGEEHVNIEGHPGRKLRIQPATPQATLLVNMVVVGDRVYQITLVCPKQYSFSPKVSTFLDSFRLTKIESPQQAVKTR